MATTLAVKYRPKTFSDVTEQSLIVQMLENMCKSELSTRNFLFIGPAGTGKTTTARIMANVLNNNKGEPIEIDAASNSGVESMRDIIQQARSYPVVGNYKVFIVDECHSLSSQAWQSLLKTLEESPAKSIFMFCTTNPEKIPDTILSRVSTFQLSKISLDGIYNRLKYVLDCEISEGRNITYTEDAVNFIAKLANGGMRDALTLLDKALAYSNDISSETLSKALNLPKYDDYFRLLQAIAKKDNKSIAETVHMVYNSGVNFVKWFEEFHSFVINIVKYILLQDINATMIPSHYVDKISKYSSAHLTICLKLANKLVKLNQELKTTNYQQEIALTYLCTIPKKS
jgi:DNA polymerase-3 subunit gamma/tau